MRRRTWGWTAPVLLFALSAAPPQASAHLHDVICALSASESGRTVFTVSRFAALKSTDGGYTWNELSVGRALIEDNPELLWFALAPDFEEVAGGGEVWFGRAGGTPLWRSPDGGLNWAPLAPESVPCPDPSSVAFSPSFAADGAVLVAMNSGGVTRFTQDGTAPVPTLLGVACPALLAAHGALYAGTRGGKLFRSADGGRSFQRVLRLDAGHSGAIKSIVDGGPGVLYLRTGTATGSSGLTRVEGERDGEWLVQDVQVPANQMNSTATTAVAYQKGPHGRTTLLALQSNSKALLVSHNRGKTWRAKDAADWIVLDRGGEPVASPTGNIEHFRWNNEPSHGRNGDALDEWSHLWAVPGTQIAFAGTWAGLFRSGDGGDSWYELDTVARTIVGLSVGKGKARGSVQVSVCTYSDYCYAGEVNLARGLPKGGALLPSSALSPVTFPDSDALDVNLNYFLLELSPNFSRDGFAMRTSFELTCRVDYSRDGMATWVRGKFVPGCTDPRGLQQSGFRGSSALREQGVLTLTISPSVAKDNIVFAGGNVNTGLLRSQDRAKSWKQVVLRNKGNVIYISCSPFFASDGAVVALSNSLGTKGSSNPNLKRGYMTHVHFSQDHGETFAIVGDQGTFMQVVVTRGAAGPLLVAVDVAGRMFVSEGTAGFRILASSAVPGRPLGYGRDGLVVSRTGVVAGAFSEGGLTLWSKGSKGNTTAPLVRDVLSDVVTATALRPEEGFWSFAGELGTYKRARKRFYDRLAFSPTFEADGIIFGTFFYSLFASSDRGVTFQKIWSVPFRPSRLGRYVEYSAEVPMKCSGSSVSHIRTVDKNGEVQLCWNYHEAPPGTAPEVGWLAPNAIYYVSRGTGVTGSLIGKQTKVASFEKCKAKCTADTTCLSISFKASNLRCRLSSAGTGGDLTAGKLYEAFDKIDPTLPTAAPTPALEPPTAATPKTTPTTVPTTTLAPSAAAEVVCGRRHGSGQDLEFVLQAASGSCSAVADRINDILTACPSIKGNHNQNKAATCSATAQGGNKMLTWAKKSLNWKANLALAAFYDNTGTKRGKTLEKKPAKGSATELLFAAHRETKGRGGKCKAVAKALNTMLADAAFNCGA